MTRACGAIALAGSRSFYPSGRAAACAAALRNGYGFGSSGMVVVPSV